MLSFWRQFFFSKMPVCGGVPGLERRGVEQAALQAQLRSGRPPPGPGRGGHRPAREQFGDLLMGEGKKIKTKELSQQQKDKDGVVVPGFRTPAPASPSKIFHGHDLGL